MQSWSLYHKIIASTVEKTQCNSNVESPVSDIIMLEKWLYHSKLVLQLTLLSQLFSLPHNHQHASLSDIWNEHPNCATVGTASAAFGDYFNKSTSALETPWPIFHEWIFLPSKSYCVDKIHIRGVIISKSKKWPWRSLSRIILNKVINSWWYSVGANVEALIFSDIIVQTRLCKGVCLSVKLQNVLEGQGQGCL